MKIGLVGYQGSGKSTLFHWLTEIEPDLSAAHSGQSAMATIQDERIEQLCTIYEPKKITRASLEIFDTPGLSRTHEGSAARLASIREAGCLVIVVAAFGDHDPAADLSSFEDDLLIADLEIMTGRLERLRESVKKPRPNRDEQIKELEALEPLHALLENGERLHDVELTPEQEKATRSFQLLTEKPRLLLINSKDEQQEAGRYDGLAPEGIPLVAINIALELELEQMEEAERQEFCQEMGIVREDRDALVRRIMEASGQMLFFTAGEKEVRSWIHRRGGTAVEAAGQIHTDLARGFIRAETMQCEDLVRLGSEREVKAENLMRREHKEYVIQDGDVITIQHNA